MKLNVAGGDRALPATVVELLLFDKHDDVQPIQIIKLEAPANQTFFFWHVYGTSARSPQAAANTSGT